MNIVICDVGLGNLRSVERALAQAAANRSKSATIHIERDPSKVRAADKIVMPGQGGFGDCARALDGEVGSILREQIARGTPYLGICLGLQVLFESSEEAPGLRGLGVFEGHVAKVRGGIDAATGTPLKIPHIGWNTADPAAAHPVLAREPHHYYFVHSYVVVPSVPGIVAATTDYGERFVSAVAKDNVVAVQFHPEKSQHEGLALLERFIDV